MFGDLDWPLNASRGLSAISEFLVQLVSGKRYNKNHRKGSQVLKEHMDCLLEYEQCGQEPARSFLLSERERVPRRNIDCQWSRAVGIYGEGWSQQVQPWLQRLLVHRVLLILTGTGVPEETAGDRNIMMPGWRSKTSEKRRRQRPESFYCIHRLLAQLAFIDSKA